jgi:hypothetical protein
VKWLAGYHPSGPAGSQRVMALGSRKGRSARGPISRPMPDFLKPPHGCACGEGCALLIQTVPARTSVATRSARAASAVKMAAARPKSLSFASATASASVAKVVTAATGPKTSSLKIVCEGVMPVKIVGATKKPPLCASESVAGAPPPQTSFPPSAIVFAI